MVATGLSGSSPKDEINERVMQSFVYEDKNEEDRQSDKEKDSNNEGSINVFSDTTNNNRQSYAKDEDDEYDIPAFLRKK
jgi:hypothetical protein